MVKTTSPPQSEATTSPQDSWLAITSLVLGVLGITGFGLLTGIPAVVTGTIALVKKQGNRGMSIAGIIMGGISTIVSLLFILLLLAMIVWGFDAAGTIPEFDQNSLPNPQDWVESSQT